MNWIELGEPNVAYISDVKVTKGRPGRPIQYTVFEMSRVKRSVNLQRLTVLSNPANAKNLNFKVRTSPTWRIIALRTMDTRVLPNFFDQVGHEPMKPSSGNKRFSLNLVIVRLTKRDL